jgi:hypothetical protein
MIEIAVNSHVISLPMISQVDLKGDRKKGAYNEILLHSVIIAAIVWSDKGSSAHKMIAGRDGSSSKVLGKAWLERVLTLSPPYGRERGGRTERPV